MVKYLLLFSLIMSFAVGINLTANNDLVKLQKKEEKRRKKIKKSVIKITNENIQKLSKESKKKVVKITGSKLGSSTTLTTQEDRENSEDPKEKTQEYWRSEKAKLENSIKFYEEKVNTLTSRLNKLASDYLIVDFPPAKNQVKMDMDKTRAELNKSKQQVPFFKSKLEQLLVRARRENIPPGWLR